MKKSFSNSFAIVILLYCAEISSLDSLKLELVQVLFRHGARTPFKESLDFYSGANRSIYEPWGFGQLTNVGKQQAYNLGSFLRFRYKDYLSANCKSEEIYAYSTAADHTKMTMALVLAGLYPPSGSAIWNSSLLWSPVPFKYTPGNLDVILRGYETFKFSKLLHQVYSSDEHKRKLKKYADAFSFLDEKTGTKASTNGLTLSYVSDVLYANEFMNTSLPTWYTHKVKKALIEVAEQVFDDYIVTSEMRKIGIGLLVRTFVENMDLNNSAHNPRKIYLYAGHAMNLALFTRVHGIEQFKWPTFGSALIFEKWRDSKNEVFVKLFARTTDGELLNLKFGYHADFCPIKDYLKIATPVMLPDDEVDDILQNFNREQIRDMFFKDPVVTKL